MRNGFIVSTIERDQRMKYTLQEPKIVMQVNVDM